MLEWKGVFFCFLFFDVSLNPNLFNRAILPLKLDMINLYIRIVGKIVIGKYKIQ